MERRRMRRKPAFGNRIMVTMLSLVMLLSMLSPGLLAGADETTTDPTVQQTPETPNDQAPAADGQTQLTDRVKTESNFKDSFIDAFMDAYDQQTQNGGEQLGSLALSYIAKYDMLKARVQALDPAAEDYAAQVEALNAEIAALDAAIAASAANGELTDAEVASVRAAAVGSVTTAAPAAPEGGEDLKERTVTAYVDNMTFAVTGKMPEGATLSVVALEDIVNDYIRTNILGLGALPAGYTGAAYDIKLLDQDGLEFQPTEQVNVGVTAQGITENADVSVYHLLGSCADDVYAGYQRDVAGIALLSRMNELIGEKVNTVNVYDGYYAFLTDSFSVYYVASGNINTTDESLANGESHEIYMAPNSEATFTVNNNASVSGTGNGITANRNRSTLTIKASEDVTPGQTATLTISWSSGGNWGGGGSSNKATIKVIIVADTAELARQEVLDKLNNPEYPVYLAVRQDPRSGIPGEPAVMGSSGYSFYNSSYASGAYNNYFADSAEGVIDESIVDYENFFIAALDDTQTDGLVDSTGITTKEVISGVNWDTFLEELWNDGNIYATDGTRIRRQDITLEDTKDKYKVIPYVIKLQQTEGIGWHIDCAIVPIGYVTLSYDINIPDLDLGLYIVNNTDNSDTNNIGVPNAQSGKPVATFDVEAISNLTTITVTNPDGSRNSFEDSMKVKSTEDPDAEYVFTFLGWNTEKDGSGTWYYPDQNPDSISIDKDTILYAQWEATPALGSGNLRISKTLAGSYTDADLNTDFTFTVEIFNSAGSASTATYEYSVYNVSSSAAVRHSTIAHNGTLTLKANQYVVIHNLPSVPSGIDTLNVKVTETVPEGYTASWTGGTAAANVVQAAIKDGTTTTVACTNSKANPTTDVVISKTVSGNMGDINKNFNFTAKIVSSGTNFIPAAYADKANNDGSFNFSLSHDQGVTFEDVPIGATLTITEKDVTPYAVTIDGDLVKAQDSAGDATKDITVEEEMPEILVENNRNVSIDTGINLNSFPFIMMLSSCIVMAVFFLIGKKRMMF